MFTRERPQTNTSSYFHELSKDISMGGKVLIPADSSEWPESWKEVEYKSYRNVEKIKLFSFKELEESGFLLGKDFNFLALLCKRVSNRNFKEREYKVTKQEISFLLLHSVAFINGSEKRVHPSAGARYPLEYYLLINNSADFSSGVYHYNLKDHSLEKIKNIENFNKDKYKISGYDWVYDSGVVFFITSIFDRNTRKYGERGYRYILQESGHVGQNLYLSAASLGYSISALGGTNDIKVENLLSIDGEKESLIYTLVLG